MSAIRKSSQVLYEEILERGLGCLGVSARHAADSGIFSAAQPHNIRACPGGCCGGGKAAERIADHGGFCAGAGRDVYAIPGRDYRCLVGGMQQLNPAGSGGSSDLESFVQELAPDPGAGGETCTFEKLLLEKEERLVYSCVDLRPKSMEELLEETDLSVPELAQILGILLKKGFVTEAFKNCYIRRI